MFTFLRDPIWQFFGAFISIIGLGISIYGLIRQKNKKSLSYVITTNTNLLRVADEIKDQVKVFYEETPLQNIYLICLSIY